MLIKLSNGKYGFIFPPDIPGAPSSPRLNFAIAPDGSAEIDGVIPFPSGHGFILLEAEPDTARCTCADANGNGQSGLTRAELPARDPRSGDLVPVALMPLAGEDIDRPGRYEVEVRVGDERGTISVLVVPLRERRKRRRRKRRRRRRGRRR